MRNVIAHDERGLRKLPGFVVPFNLLPRAEPAQQLEWVIGRLGTYAAKGEVQQATIPAGGEHLRIDQRNTMAPGAAWRLRQIDPAYPGRVVANVGIVNGELPPDATIQLTPTRAEVTIFLYRAVISPGDVTLFDPGAPYSFTDLRNSPYPIPSVTVDIGPADRM